MVKNECKICKIIIITVVMIGLAFIVLCMAAAIYSIMQDNSKWGI